MTAELAPGDRVRLTAQRLYSMGALVGELAEQVFILEACTCDLCALGRHVAVGGGRHFGRAALRLAGVVCVDELRAVDSDAITAALAKGLGNAARGRR